ncbi:hypothetical protein O181_001711 [Austropuccinia psidii MF-1]|uniref:Uncharacterized protein n=1 Tax=Austropuccinia psidii MF-1 TaxID=1389203 RepID=A0A9Q3GCN8_9BASI|nr:hypothetical protein [Austropuccinia psidii MF-1]
MEWSGDASLALELSMTPHSCPFPVYWPSLFLWTGSMHMESQPGWPALDLSCLFVLISPKEKIEARECLSSGIIPGLKEPTDLQLNFLLMPLIKELKELRQGNHFSPTSTGPSGSFICVSILTAIVDVVAMHKLTGFISHSGNHFCNFCTIHKAQIEEIGPQFHYMRSYQNHKSTIAKWLQTFHIGMQPEWLILT